MSKAKAIGWAAAGVVAVIVLLQNREPVTARFLFWSFKTQQVVMLLGTLALGFAVGMLVGGIRRR